MITQIKVAIGVGLGAVALGGALWYAQPDQDISANHNEESQVGKSAVQLGSVPPSNDFGPISMKNGVVTKDFVITNPLDSTLKLTKLYTSCMCTKATFVLGDTTVGTFGMPGHGVVPPLNVTLEPKQQATIKVAFDPAAHGPSGIGRIERVVTVEDETGVVLELPISATVTP